MQGNQKEPLAAADNLGAPLGKRPPLSGIDLLENLPAKKLATDVRKDSPYLSSIKRHLLDFDQEKVCSISNSKTNVYCCLVCGVFYTGKGKDTYAYKHALEQAHYLYISLEDQRVYCLPDNYEIECASIQDIKVASRVSSEQPQASILARPGESTRLKSSHLQKSRRQAVLSG